MAADLHLLHRIKSQIEDAAIPIEPTRDAAQRETHLNALIRAKSEFNSTCDSANRQAQSLEQAVALAIADNAALSFSSQDLYKELATFRIREIQARLQLCEKLNQRHIIVSSIECYEETNVKYIDSDYKKLVESMRELQVRADQAINLILIANSKLPDPHYEDHGSQPTREKKPHVKPNSYLQPSKFTNGDATTWSEWFPQYRRFFRASNLDKTEQDEQYGYLEKLIEKELFDRCVQLAPPGTHCNPLLEIKGSIFEIIEQNLDHTHPLRARRQDWMEITPHSGEKPLQILGRLQKAEDTAKIRQASIDDILTMKRLTCLSGHKDLIREILKIDVSDSNPLTPAKIHEKAVQYTRIEAEMSSQGPNSHDTVYAIRSRSHNSTRCQCCNKPTKDSQQFCDKCFKNGPPRSTYCPICRIPENHVKEACKNKVVTWPRSSPWQKSQSRSKSPGRAKNTKSRSASPGNRNQNFKQKGSKGRRPRTRFSNRVSLVKTNETNDESDDDSDTSDDWNPASSTEGSESEEVETVNMVRLGKRHAQPSESDPEENPVQYYADLPVSSSEDEEEDEKPGPSSGLLNQWYSQATQTWRSGEMPEEEDIASPMVNRWRSRNQGLDSSCSDSDSSIDENEDPEPFENCKYNDCPTVNGCTPTKCALDPVENVNMFDMSNSSSEVNMELWDSRDTEDNLSMSLLDIHDEQDQIVLDLSHEDEYINSVSLMNSEIVAKALADENCHNVSKALGETDERLDNMNLKIKHPESVEKYRDVRACPDTGATISLLSQKMAKKLNLQIFKYKGKCKVANNQIMDIIGQTFALCRIGHCTRIIRFLVAKEVCERILIGRQALIDLEVISRNFPEQMSRKRKFKEAHMEASHPMTTRSKSKRKLPNIDDLPEPERVLRKRIKKLYEDESINVTKVEERKKQKMKVTEEDFENLKAHLIKKFPKNFVKGTVTTRINAKPTKIELEKDAVLPPKNFAPRIIPVNTLPECMKTFKEYVKAGTVKRLEPGKVPLVVSPTFFLTKPDGISQRLLTDFKKLNEIVKTKSVHFPSTHEVIQRLPKDAKYHMVVDLKDGFFQQKLAKESTLLTCFSFNSQMGPYSGTWKYETLPMGLKCSPDAFNEVTDYYLNQGAGIPNMIKVMDDILLSAPDMDTLKRNAMELMRRLEVANMKVSEKKIQIGKSVKFVGVRIIENTCQPDESRIKALFKLKPPTSVTEAKGFMGYVNQLSIWTPSLQIKLQPINELTKKNVPFLWEPHHQKAFDDVIAELAQQAKVTSFDPNKKTILITDTSKLHGAAGSLFQEESDGTLTHLGSHSRSLRDNEKNWSASEIEYLALTFSLKQFKYYLSGLKWFEHLTDHSALTSLTKMDLDKIPNKRLLNLRLACEDYNFTTRYIKGAKGIHYLIDQLSRHPLPIDEHCDIINLCVQNSLLSTSPDNPDPLLEDLKEKAKSCDQYQKTIDFFRSDMAYNDLPENHPARQITKDMLDNMSMENELLIHNDKIFVPLTARKSVIETLHKAHSGKDAMIMEAKATYWWPNMNLEIADIARSCTKCIENSPSAQSQPVQMALGKWPGQLVAVDPFEIPGCKKTFLAIADSFSGFCWIYTMKDGKTSTIIKWLNNFIHQTDLRPMVIQSDFGVQFQSSEYNQWCDHWKITPQLSSPNHQASNGLVESHIKELKTILIEHNGQTDSMEYHIAMNRFRNHVVRRTGESRHSMLYGYKGRCDLPQLPIHFAPIDREKALQKKIDSKWSQKKYRDKHATTLSTLRPNQKVKVQDLNLGKNHKKFAHQGTILKVDEKSDDVYWVKLDGNAGVVKRNRVHLKLVHKRAKCVRFLSNKK